MASHVTCNICNETISYNPNEVWKIASHLQRKHCRDNVGHFIVRKDERSYKCMKRKEKMYKTTVETWNRGPTLLYCIRCKKSAPPLIRKQRHKVARSSLGALCLLGCWPLCFLPFMICRGQFANAYCRDCGLHLGTVNMRTGTFQQAQTLASVDVPKICVDCLS